MPEMLIKMCLILMIYIQIQNYMLCYNQVYISSHGADNTNAEFHFKSLISSSKIMINEFKCSIPKYASR